MTRHATGRPAGFAGRSGPPTTSGALDKPLIIVMTARRKLKLAVQNRKTLEHLAECYGQAGPCLELLLRIERARQDVTRAEASLHRAVLHAQRSIRPQNERA